MASGEGDERSGIEVVFLRGVRGVEGRALDPAFRDEGVCRRREVGRVAVKDVWWDVDGGALGNEAGYS